MKRARFFRVKLRSPHGVITTYESGNIYELHAQIKKELSAGFVQISTTLDPVIFDGIEFEDIGRKSCINPGIIYTKTSY